MSLQEWKDQMQEQFMGAFVIEQPSHLIRHATREDGQGHKCCPIIAFAFDENDDFYDAENVCAEFVGCGLGLDPDAVEAIMDASDGRGRDHEDLREWMEAVLVHGRVYEA